MRAPAHHAYHNDQDVELAQWPGVTWRREHRGKHLALVLEFDGVSRFVIYPTSPGDAYRGGLNHLRDIRAALTALGAKRARLQRAAERRRLSSRPRRLSRCRPARSGKAAWAAIPLPRSPPCGLSRKPQSSQPPPQRRRPYRC